MYFQYLLQKGNLQWVILFFLFLQIKNLPNLETDSGYLIIKTEHIWYINRHLLDLSEFEHLKRFFICRKLFSLTRLSGEQEKRKVESASITSCDAPHICPASFHFSLPYQNLIRVPTGSNIKVMRKSYQSKFKSVVISGHRAWGRIVNEKSSVDIFSTMCQCDSHFPRFPVSW